MGNQKSECFYARRVWLLVVIALAVQQSTARFIEDDCPGVVGNRNVHSMVMRVCEDCYNVFRHPEVAVGCRRACFSSKMFKSCLSALQREEEYPDFLRLIGILNAGRK